MKIKPRFSPGDLVRFYSTYLNEVDKKTWGIVLGPHPSYHANPEYICVYWGDLHGKIHSHWEDELVPLA